MAELTNDELRAIEARALAATPGPWMAEHDEDIEGRADEDFVCNSTRRIGAIYELYDVEFIAHAREDMTKLIAEIRRLQGELPQEGKLDDDNEVY